MYGSSIATKVRRADYAQFLYKISTTRGPVKHQLSFLEFCIAESPHLALSTRSSPR